MVIIIWVFNGTYGFSMVAYGLSIAIMGFQWG